MAVRIDTLSVRAIALIGLFQARLPILKSLAKWLAVAALIPFWKGDDPKPYAKSEFTYIEAFDNCDGQLPQARLGFFAR